MKVFRPRKIERLIEREGEVVVLVHEQILVLCETDGEFASIIKHIKGAIAIGVAIHTYKTQGKRIAEMGVDTWMGHHEVIVAFTAYEPREMEWLRGMTKEVLIENRPKQVREKAEKRRES